MSGRTITSGESLSRDDEGCSVRAEVLEEVGQAVKEDKALGSSGRRSELIIAEAFGAHILLVNRRQL